MAQCELQVFRKASQCLNHFSGDFWLPQKIQESKMLEKMLWMLAVCHSNVSMCIHHTVLYTFCKVLMRRICLTIKVFGRWSLTSSFNFNVWFRGIILKRNQMLVTLWGQRVWMTAILRQSFFPLSSGQINHARKEDWGKCRSLFFLI